MAMGVVGVERQHSSREEGGTGDVEMEGKRETRG